MIKNEPDNDGYWIAASIDVEDLGCKLEIESNRDLNQIQVDQL